MKQLRLVSFVFAALVCAASVAVAGDNCAGQAAGSKDACAKSARTAAATATCPMHGATKASAGSCSMHGTTATAASNAGCCAGKNASAMASSPKCDMKGAAMHAECAVCTDETACDEEVRGLNAHSQVVELRNGTMIVYTAENPENVRALQVALARHNAHIMSALAAGGEHELCGGCKSFRGAMASGKFSRELVNVKTGVQVLLTSNDRTIVRQIHEMTGAQAAARIKS